EPVGGVLGAADGRPALPGVDHHGRPLAAAVLGPGGRGPHRGGGDGERRGRPGADDQAPEGTAGHSRSLPSTDSVRAASLPRRPRTTANATAATSTSAAAAISHGTHADEPSSAASSPPSAVAAPSSADSHSAAGTSATEPEASSSARFWPESGTRDCAVASRREASPKSGSSGSEKRTAPAPSSPQPIWSPMR